MWYKSWVEVRWRLVLMVLLNAFIGALLLDDAVPANVWRARLSGNLPVIFVMNAIVLAGSGVASQFSQRPGQLVHPSMMFLLSLPIARSRIVLVRQVVGAISALALLSATIAVYAAAAPELREILTPGQGLLFAICVASVTLTAYATSALLSTMLDQLWQTYGAMALIAGVLGVFPATRFWNTVLSMNSTPASSGGNAWMNIGVGFAVCAVLSAAMAYVAVRIVQRKQF